MGSVILDREESYFFTTGALSGPNATISADGSRLDISLDTPIAIPSGSIDTSIEVQSASIWNTSPNISVAKGNNLFDYIVATVAQPQLTIPDGLYSIDTLNAELQRQFVNAGNAADIINLVGNNSTQKVVAVFKIGIQMDGTFLDSVIDSILGFAFFIGGLATGRP